MTTTELDLSNLKEFLNSHRLTNTSFYTLLYTVSCYYNTTSGNKLSKALGMSQSTYSTARRVCYSLMTHLKPTNTLKVTLMNSTQITIILKD